MALKIKTIFIYEILGRPPEHIKITLEQLLDRIGETTGVKIVSRKVHDPHPIENESEEKNSSEKEIYSTFAETELEIEGLPLLFRIILNTLPSNIEIVEPAEIGLKNFDLTGILSELSIKLHKYDEIAKIMALEKSQLINFMKVMNEKIKSLGGESMINFSDGKDAVNESNVVNENNIKKKKSVEKKILKKKK